MENNIFISRIYINGVRHLKEIEIPLSTKERKHLILTGKNGSGKTSLLNAMAIQLNSIVCPENSLELLENIIDRSNHEVSEDENNRVKRLVAYFEKIADNSASADLVIELNRSTEDIRSLLEEGKFIIAYYQADRAFQAEIPKHVEKVELKNRYGISESPRNDFIKYLLDLKMTEALAAANGKNEKADKIRQWF